MPRYLVTILGKDYGAMADLVREYKIDVLRQTVQRLDEKGGYSVDALVDRQQIRALETGGYKVEVREDTGKTRKARQAEVGKGDRYRRPGPE